MRLKIPRTAVLALSGWVAVAAVPAGFDRVAEIRETAGGLELVSEKRHRARCALNLEFLADCRPCEENGILV